VTVLPIFLCLLDLVRGTPIFRETRLFAALTPINLRQENPPLFTIYSLSRFSLCSACKKTDNTRHGGGTGGYGLTDTTPARAATKSSVFDTESGFCTVNTTADGIAGAAALVPFQAARPVLLAKLATTGAVTATALLDVEAVALVPAASLGETTFAIPLAARRPDREASCALSKAFLRGFTKNPIAGAGRP
jgi:hypothetical protein